MAWRRNIYIKTTCKELLFRIHSHYLPHTYIRILSALLPSNRIRMGPYGQCLSWMHAAVLLRSLVSLFCGNLYHGGTSRCDVHTQNLLFEFKLFSRLISFSHYFIFFAVIADKLNSSAFTPVKMDLNGNIKVPVFHVPPLAFSYQLIPIHCVSSP